MKLSRGLVAGAALALIGALSILPTGGCSGQSSAATDTPLVKCTPGAYVFCRCQDRAEGTKLCNDDGHSFQKCDPCETAANPAVPDDPNHPPDVVDAGHDVQQPSTSVCGDKIVQDGEDCDDGNVTDDDGCDGQCHLSGMDPLASRSCPGLDTHVWTKPVSFEGTTVGSTNTGSAKPTCISTMGGNPTTGAAGADRVFKVTAHKTGVLTIVTSDTNYDSFLYVTESCAPAADGSLGYLGCANNTNGVGGETLSIPVTSGKSYSVVVDGAGISQQEGAFRVTFSIQ